MEVIVLQHIKIEDSGYIKDLMLADGWKLTTIELDKVLMVLDGKDSKVGSPFLKDAKVIAEVLKHSKSSKIKVFKMKRRKGYRRTLGHRQNFTEVLIKSIKK